MSASTVGNLRNHDLELVCHQPLCHQALVYEMSSTIQGTMDLNTYGVEWCSIRDENVHHISTSETSVLRGSRITHVQGRRGTEFGCYMRSCLNQTINRYASPLQSPLPYGPYDMAIYSRCICHHKPERRYAEDVQRLQRP